MELAQLLNDNWFLIVVLLMGGLLMGFIAGLLGIGGGAMLVPILYEVFQRIGVSEALCLHLSIGTSLLVMVPTSLRSFRAHKKRGSVDLRVLKTLMVLIIIGVLVGIMAAKYSNPYAIKIVWVSCLSILALKMIFARDHWAIDRHSGRAWVHVGRIRTLRLACRVYWLCLAHWPGYCCSS